MNNGTQTPAASPERPKSLPRLRNETEIAAVMAQVKTIGLGRPREIVPLLCQVVAVRPGEKTASALLELALEAMGEKRAEPRARDFAAIARLDHPVLKRATQAIEARRPADADIALRGFLKDHPDDPVGLRMMANVLTLGGRNDDAERLLLRALKLAPGFAEARRNLVDGLMAQGKLDDALVQLDLLLEADPASRDYRAVKASALKRSRRTGEAVVLFRETLADHPSDSDLRIDLANALRTDGQAGAAIETLRDAVRRDPAAGRGWYALADLKVVAFDEADIAAMQDALLDDDLPRAAREALHFALGRALEGAGRHRDAFAHYALGNAFHRSVEPYDARKLEMQLGRSAAVVKAGVGDFAPVEPSGAIFVLGMPRSGSTLVEQILASHPEIEATEELPYLRMLANTMSTARTGAYPEGLATLTTEQRTALRGRYLDQAKAHGSETATWFVDKAPANWQHFALIAAILPDAKIIDVRRHPLDCGFSNYAQRFGRGNEFAYSLGDIGHYYLQYAGFMQLVDTHWPGRVHRVHHEALIADPEAEARRLLDHIGVPYDPAVLRFHEQTDPVFSASSEQVRRPINRDGVDRWRPFDTWLGPLKTALGPVLADYPGTR